MTQLASVDYVRARFRRQAVPAAGSGPIATVEYVEALAERRGVRPTGSRALATQAYVDARLGTRSDPDGPYDPTLSSNTGLSGACGWTQAARLQRHLHHLDLRDDGLHRDVRRADGDHGGFGELGDMRGFGCIDSGESGVERFIRRTEYGEHAIDVQEFERGLRVLRVERVFGTSGDSARSSSTCGSSGSAVDPAVRAGTRPIPPLQRYRPGTAGT